MTPVSPELAALLQRARAGEADAQFELGERLMKGRDAPFSPREGADWIDAAAEQNHPAALRLAAVFLARGVKGAADWPKAIQFVSRAAALGDAQAQAELTMLGEPARFDIQLWLTAPPMQILREAPRIAVIERFLAPEICDWFIARTKPRLEAARVYDPIEGGTRHGERRTNMGAGFGPAESDLVMQATHARIAAALGMALAQQEAPNVLHYVPGQQFLPHYDFIDPAVAHFQDDLAQKGQRILTFLVYLNDDFEGGETDFPSLNWRFKGKRGDALVFWNVTDGAPEPLALHAGLSPTRGEKWLLSQWVRERALPLI
jgi:prolyl 4-hydroxylase